jgi:hypothetical protein
MSQFANMNSTIEVLRNEAMRLRSLAERLDAFAAELDGQSPITPQLTFYGIEPRAAGVASVTGTTPAISAPGMLAFANGVKRNEFKGMTQHAAILKALEMFGPQTTKELFTRLNAGGMEFRKPVYVTSLLSRLKEVVERTPENKVKLKDKAVAENTQNGH